MAVFTGRPRIGDTAVPPGQHVTESFPVLSVGPTPSIAVDEWEFAIQTEARRTHRWSWSEFLELPGEDITVDIHCVTSWSKLGTRWRGVSVDALFAGVETSVEHVMAHSFGGYTTNLALADVLGGRAWIVYEYEGSPLSAEHGGPARLLVPHLYLWKSATWIRGLVMQDHEAPGFWEQNGYHLHGDPWREERYGAWRDRFG